MFKRILNVVHCSQPLLLLTLFKHFPRPRNGQNRVFQPKFRPRRLWRRTESNRQRLLPSQKFDRYFEEILSYHVSSGGPSRAQNKPFQRCVGPKISQIRVVWGSAKPRRPYCSTKILTLNLLLFPIPIVVLLLLFNTSTLFSP